MAGLDCPMQTKALNLFWHKAELRLVEQPEPEAPVFAISRPTFFGGREEFILQYPARLEPPTKRDLARHRFTVRHGKKRRSFQAPDAATFETWLSALEQALEPTRESDQCNTPSSTATTATATSSQGRRSIAGSTGIRESSRGRVSTLGGASSRTSSNASVAMPPPSRITLERQCFKRDPNNHKLLSLHRPAPTIAGTAINEAERDDVPAYHNEVEEDYINIFASEEAPSKTTNELPHANSTTNEVVSDGLDTAVSAGIATDEAGNVEQTAVAGEDALVEEISSEALDACEEGVQDQERGSSAVVVEDMQSVDVVSYSGPLDDPLVTDDVAHVELENINSEVKTVVEGLVAAMSEVERGPSSTKSEGIDIESEVQAIVEELVTGVFEAENDELAAAVASISTTVNEAGVTNPEVKALLEALVATVVKNEGRSGIHLVGEALSTENTAAVMDEFVVSGVESTPVSSSSKEPAAEVLACSATLLTKRRWVPLDPANSSLIWVRCSVDADVNSAPRSIPRRKAVKPARKWVPVDPSSTRLIWIRRVENSAARIQSRYKATSSTRKWIPLDPDNSRFIWVRRQIVPVGSTATPLVDSSSFRV